MAVSRGRPGFDSPSRSNFFIQMAEVIDDQQADLVLSDVHIGAAASASVGQVTV